MVYYDCPASIVCLLLGAVLVGGMLGTVLVYLLIFVQGLHPIGVLDNLVPDNGDVLFLGLCQISIKRGYLFVPILGLPMYLTYCKSACSFWCRASCKWLKVHNQPPFANIICGPPFKYTAMEQNDSVREKSGSTCYKMTAPGKKRMGWDRLGLQRAVAWHNYIKIINLRGAMRKCF